MSNKCVICGTVKNCGPYLEKVFKNIEKIGGLFVSYNVIFAYDDSIDNTLELLQIFQAKFPEGKVEIYVETEPILPYRSYNIARARNHCLDLIRKKYADYEYFIMIDCDDVCSQEVKLGPLEFYLSEEMCLKWDALSFNKKPYYDTWALSIYPYVFSNMHFANYERYGTFIEDIIRRTPRGSLINCFSAFNGFAIYKTNKFIQHYYDPRPRIDLIPKHLMQKNIDICGPMYFKGKAKLVDCEHRSFHLMAVNNGARIRIAPEVIF